MPRIETHCIEWKCDRCGNGARLPQLHNATITAIRNAIERGHDRRSPGCHVLHGIKHVRAIQDGKTLRFAQRPAIEFESRRDEAQT
jgi:hypothetical protein